jgi:thiamine monophosphate synthase
MGDVGVIKRICPKYVFISPIFWTKTHPNAKPFGVLRAMKVAKMVKTVMPNCRIIFLGGMTQKRFFSIKKLDFDDIIYGFAGIRF